MVMGIFLLFFLKDGVLLEIFSHLGKENSSTYYYISRYYIIWQLGGLVSKQHSHGVIEYLACWGKLQLHTEEGHMFGAGICRIEMKEEEEENQSFFFLFHLGFRV